MPRRPPIHSPFGPAMQARLDAQKAAEKKRAAQKYEQSPQRQADLGFYRSMRWRKLREWFLAQPENALCVECKKLGSLVPAQFVDHIKPRKEFPELAWDGDNLQGLCLSCHSRKTKLEQGRRGRGIPRLSNDDNA